MIDESNRFKPDIHEQKAPPSYRLAMELRAKAKELGLIAKHKYDISLGKEPNEVGGAGYTGFVDSMTPIDVDLGEIDKIKPFDLADFDDGVISLHFETFGDGSRFAFPGDEGFFKPQYSLIISPEHPPFIGNVAAHGKGDDSAIAVHEYLTAVNKGEVKPPLILNEDQCQSVIDNVIPKLTPEYIEVA